MADNNCIPTADWEIKGGTLHATFSLLVEHERLTENGLGGLAKKVRERKKEGRIAAAIEPMFDDISDRKRQVFSDEVLVDAEYSDKQPPHAMETISLIVPQKIRWCTEGTSWVFDSGCNTGWEWSGIECRYFWFLHSNGDLSYHVSLKMPYQHTLKYYYALALVQKLFFPSESPKDGLKVVDSEKSEFRAFLIDKFENHFERLLSHHPISQPRESENWGARLIRLIKSLLSHHPTQSLKPEKLLEIHTQDGMGRLHHVRAAFLLEDACFDHVLREREKGGYLNELKEHMKAEPRSNNLGDKQNQIDIPEGLKNASNCNELLALLFLSGYLQNIIDFFEQDEAEFVDGTDPLYPKPLEDDPNFLLYATQNVLFEVVRESRSLRSGCKWVGTCPYLFLVHVTLFHDEALVNRFARMMSGLEVAVQDKSGDYRNVENLSRKDLATLVENFRLVRLSVFAKVEKYMHLNIMFLYDTEQSFYKVVLEDRGIEERFKNLTQLTSRLSETVEGLHEQAQQKATDFLNVLVIAIGGLSIFQVLFAMTQAWRSEPKDARLSVLANWAQWDLIFTVVFGILAFVIIIYIVYRAAIKIKALYQIKSPVPPIGQPERKR